MFSCCSTQCIWWCYFQSNQTYLQLPFLSFFSFVSPSNMDFFLMESLSRSVFLLPASEQQLSTWCNWKASSRAGKCCRTKRSFSSSWRSQICTADKKSTDEKGHCWHLIALYDWSWHILHDCIWPRVISFVSVLFSGENSKYSSLQLFLYLWCLAWWLVLFLA